MEMKFLKSSSGNLKSFRIRENSGSLAKGREIESLEDFADAVIFLARALISTTKS